MAATSKPTDAVMEGETDGICGWDMLSDYDKTPHIGSDDIRPPVRRMGRCDQMDL
jgi:hypothetical protein